eukprot:CAMPEP_0171200162 /NCGR_PEP_ID=MMETSP0790-20130122/23838_1 /TAXON_ID=2925 /ORGANISM="Alexandrium catenella, Strain OF101" /LENGTH=297 /DNA_ID=CAMNT_0011665533 /DNA_START=98 /DNA_END=991 /DNA_ORIENTATION=-
MGALLMFLSSHAEALRRHDHLQHGKDDRQSVPTQIESPTQIKFDRLKGSALVFTMPKVASIPIMLSLAASPSAYQYATQPQRAYWPLLKTHARSVAVDFLKKGQGFPETWVVTAVRQPYSRLVSSYFEAIDRGLHNQSHVQRMDIEEMSTDFLSWVNSSSGAGCDPFFRADLPEVIGMNLTEYTFPVEQGKLVVHGKANGKLIVAVLLRVEDASRWTEIMRAQVPWWGRSHEHAQDSKETWYSDIYKRFSRTFTWPKDEAARLLECDHFRFYSESERQAFYRQAIGEGRPPQEPSVS